MNPYCCWRKPESTPFLNHWMRCFPQTQAQSFVVKKKRSFPTCFAFDLRHSSLSRIVHIYIYIYNHNIYIYIITYYITLVAAKDQLILNSKSPVVHMSMLQQSQNKKQKNINTPHISWCFNSVKNHPCSAGAGFTIHSIYLWVNENISLTWIVGPLKGMITYHLPRYIHIYIYVCVI